MDITVKIDKKAGTMTITVPMNRKPKPSSSGKSLVLASTSGNVVTDAEHDGKPVIVGLNAYIKAD